MIDRYSLNQGAESGLAFMEKDIMGGFVNRSDYATLNSRLGRIEELIKRGCSSAGFRQVQSILNEEKDGK